MKKLFSILLIVFCFINISYAQKKIKKDDLLLLRNIMAGSFSTEAQSKRDSNYYDIRLQMRPIWEERKDCYWFYVEQAMVKSMDKPYRQRVYHLYKLNDTCIVIQVCNLKDPMRFAGVWRQTDALNFLNPDSLESQDGCAVYFKKIEKEHFSGSTSGKQCMNNLKESSYTTIEFSIIKGLINYWERGWDANDKQVRGAIDGGYMFVKIQNW